MENTSASNRVTSDHLPAMYRGYSKRSARAQNDYLRSQRRLLWLLIAAAVASAVGKLVPALLNEEYAAYIDRGTAAASLVLFVMGLVLAQRQRQQTKPEAWYDARAMAESTKSIAWKFMMGAEPYHGPDGGAVFRADLLKLLKDAQQKTSPSESDGEQITAEMLNVRSMSVVDRVAVYRIDRVQGQCQWYTRRSREHDEANRRWEMLITATLAIAAGLNAVALLVKPLTAVAGVALAIVPCAIAWNQTQRHRELTHSYAFTSHEIGLLAVARDPTTEEELARFVADCESAFSREHTMWRARRENAEA
jgi:SMODS and SLOG-associating 2TM effector domain 1/SMODS and SLOG-associating 2TM effector domain 3